MTSSESQVRNIIFEPVLKILFRTTSRIKHLIKSNFMSLAPDSSDNQYDSEDKQTLLVILIYSIILDRVELSVKDLDYGMNVYGCMCDIPVKN